MTDADRLDAKDIPGAVRAALAQHAVLDFHTHLYSPRFGTPFGGAGGGGDPSGLLLWGVDELLTYHYVIAEFFRSAPPDAPPAERFFALSKREQADLVWRHLFAGRSPVSEACRGVLTTLQALGLETSPGALASARRFFAEQDPDRHVDRVMELANVRSITMTNDVFDDAERARWLADPRVGEDPRFRCVLRLDPLLVAYPGAATKLRAWGYDVGDPSAARTIEEARRFLRDWIDRMKAIYLAASLPAEFTFPAAPGDADAAAGQAMLERVVLPVCAERGLPFAMMIGTRRGANPVLGVAGDTLGRADVNSVARLCREFPRNRFFVTMLSRENQHELCVVARKFANLMVFGCWWFLNTPHLIEEITRMRLELLGTGFIPQHSDARVMDQLIYKWDHSRRVIAKVMTEKYLDLCETGWPLTRAAICDDVTRLFRDNFLNHLGSPEGAA